MNDEEHKKAYYSEIDFIRELENRNDIARDSTLIQLSVGLLAILAAFGSQLLVTNKTLSYTVIGFLGVTVLSVITGFATTDKMFRAIHQKMRDNVSSNKKFYDDYTATPWQDVNRALKLTSHISFSLGMIFFIALLIIYMGEV